MPEFRIYSTVKSGEIGGETSATRLPDIPCQMVMFVATNSNTGDVYLGGSGVTIPNNTQDATSGFELKPSAQTPWLPIPNLNLLFIICDNAGDDLTYIALS